MQFCTSIHMQIMSHFNSKEGAEDQQFISFPTLIGLQFLPGYQTVHHKHVSSPISFQYIFDITMPNEHSIRSAQKYFIGLLEVKLVVPPLILELWH